MSKSTPAISENISTDCIKSLCELHAIHLAEEDLNKVQQQFQLIASHAQRVMEFDLHEEIEPAGEFRP